MPGVDYKCPKNDCHSVPLETCKLPSSTATMLLWRTEEQGVLRAYRSHGVAVVGGGQLGEGE